MIDEKGYIMEKQQAILIVEQFKETYKTKCQDFFKKIEIEFNSLKQFKHEGLKDFFDIYEPELDIVYRITDECNELINHLITYDSVERIVEMFLKGYKTKIEEISETDSLWNIKLPVFRKMCDFIFYELKEKNENI